MGIPLFQVDAFTRTPYKGNPAAVCLLDGPADADWMQDVAREMNLPATAFLYSLAEGDDLRWFTPANEVGLCGHATLASAHVLWETGRLPADAAPRFHTHSGVVTARKKGSSIEMDFPKDEGAAAEAPEELLRALGVTPLYVVKNRSDYLVEVESEGRVRALQPDLALLATLPTRGVIVTARSDSREFDFVSRFFGPAAGIPEDPVTGSAHCCLGPYWGARLGKREMVGYQARCVGAQSACGSKATAFYWAVRQSSCCVASWRWASNGLRACAHYNCPLRLKEKYLAADRRHWHGTQ